MKERLTELQERVQSVRSALESMAERAAGLRGRVQAFQNREAALASDPYANGTAPQAPQSELAQSLERLAVIRTPTDLTEGDDGRFVSDAWEIALINEEGE
jgi:hypothetical protein